MSWSMKLFTVRGIPVRVHASFLLIVGWAAYLGFTAGRADRLGSIAFMVAFVLLLFVCVLLHELGHGLVGQLFGAQVADITLWPIGGVARMSKMPERPYQEFVMTAAGPVTNILLTILLSIIAVAWIGPDESITLVTSPWLLRAFVSGMDGQTLLLLLIFNNALLAVFNLIPAFPLDGGRMLRALLAAVTSYRRATIIASIIGQMLALLLGMVALLDGQVFLGMIALFVFFGAWQEREQARYRTGLRGLHVRQAMQPVGARLHPLQTLGDVMAENAASPQAAFLVVDAGRLVGLLTRGELLTVLRKVGPGVRVGQHMHRDITQFAPDDALAESGDRLWQGAPAAVVVEQGQVVGTLSRADLLRLTEVMNARPELLPKN